MNDFWTRRLFVQTAFASSLGLVGTRLAFAQGEAVKETPAPQRALELRNTHTGESLHLVYRRGDEYDADAIAKLRNLMRDHRNGEVHDIDVALYDQLYDLSQAAHCDARFEIISGYRSPESNASMAAEGRGVAKHSLHMQGKAIDVRLHGCTCATLRDLALTAARGGVGYYRNSDFVHVDTGRFRTWTG